MSESKSVSKRNIPGLLAVGITGTAAVGLLALSLPFVMPAMRKICLPYVPATDTQVQNVIKLLRKKKGNVIDLGSGDGRIVIEAAKSGYPSYGVELNPWLVLFSRAKAASLGLSKIARFQKQDIWKTNLKNYDNVVIFGVEEMMQQLETKLSSELSPGSSIIACRFPLPNWKPIRTIEAGIDTVWLYEKKKPQLEK